MQVLSCKLRFCLVLFYGIIFFKDSHTFFKQIVLVIINKRGTHAQAFLVTTCGNQTDG